MMGVQHNSQIGLIQTVLSKETMSQQIRVSKPIYSLLPTD